MKKNITIGIILVVVALVGLYFFTRTNTDEIYRGDNQLIEDENSSENGNGEGDENSEEDAEQAKATGPVTIGTSVDGQAITAHRFGTGDTEILFVGGIHGGYSWNTALLGYEMVEYFNDNPEIVPENVTVSIVPVLNPDGLKSVTGTAGMFESTDVSNVESVKVAGRFNANDVDLNRNFDCDWQSDAKWQSRDVDGGTSAFSEPESQAIRAYINQYGIDAAVVYYSSAGGVYASSCHNGVLPETRDLTNAYAKASGYKAFEEFDFYEITGDMVNWLAKQEIPAISILLTNHVNTEFSKNLSGVEAILEYYAE